MDLFKRKYIKQLEEQATDDFFEIKRLNKEIDELKSKSKFDPLQEVNITFRDGSAVHYENIKEVGYLPVGHGILSMKTYSGTTELIPILDIKTVQEVRIPVPAETL